MVYVDDARILWKGKLRFHLTADSLEELHAFTKAIGVKPCWYHRGAKPHYDITEPQRQAALDAGALAVDGRTLAEKARALGQKPVTIRGPEYIVELEPGVWLTAGRGDPSRTLVEASARKYRNHHAAETALSVARQHRPFPSARIVPVPTLG